MIDIPEDEREAFVQWQYSEFKKQAEIKKCQDKLEEMANDLKRLNKDEFKAKYGNPSKVWAETKWALYKARKGIVDPPAKK